MMISKKSTILIVEDNDHNRKIIAGILQKFTPHRICTARDAAGVIQAIDSNTPDLILMDIIMPAMDGFELARVLKNKPTTRDIPIIFLTVKNEIMDRLKGFKLGGVDFITKPFNKYELLARINIHLKIKNLQDELRFKNTILENRELHLNDLIIERTDRIERITMAMIKSLEKASFYNDFDTGNHLKRVTEYSTFLAEKYGCESAFINRLRMYMPLHDIGKIGIPDDVLKKPDKYSDNEFSIMKNHVLIGYQMLESEEIDPVAKNIVLYHHEKWDGSGYFYGLKKEAIPIEARIAALSDVYDALISERIYKKSYTEDEAEAIILENAGKHFEPRLVKIFFSHKKKIREIKNSVK
ncbi:MAG: response regulator [Candidatus Delongbacteria bacterium]|nr:response regulator [Candidatus Delongbacteria bacterium]